MLTALPLLQMRARLPRHERKPSDPGSGQRAGVGECSQIADTFAAARPSTMVEGGREGTSTD
jgi:hypothetical protein